jgi:serine/threonine protein kinase
MSSHFLVFVYITFQHISHGDGRQEVTSRTGRSGARCRNSIASCADEQPHIGNYRLLKTIGKGNFAKVKLARHILTGREVNPCLAFAVVAVLLSLKDQDIVNNC